MTSNLVGQGSSIFGRRSMKPGLKTGGKMLSVCETDVKGDFVDGLVCGT